MGIILSFLFGIFALSIYQRLTGVITHKTMPETNKVIIHEHRNEDHLKTTQYNKDTRQVTGFKKSNNGRLEYTAVYA